jgi:hypothetical protein
MNGMTGRRKRLGFRLSTGAPWREKGPGRWGLRASGGGKEAVLPRPRLPRATAIREGGVAANINVDKALRVSTERDDDVAVTKVLPKRSHPRSSSCPALASCRKIARKSLSTARADLLGRKAAAAGSNDIVVILTSLRNATNGTRQIQNTPWGPAPTWLLARSLHHRVSSGVKVLEKHRFEIAQRI